MQIITLCTRTHKRKLVLILSALVTVLIVNLTWNNSSTSSCLFFCSSDDDNSLRLRKLSQPFNWDSVDSEESENNATEEYKPSTCRNSVQGKYLVTDDKGYVCERIDLQGNGCCDKESKLGRYSCTDCDTSVQCCAQYEFCISCCLRKEQRPSLQEILKEAAENNNVLFVSVSDHFELCLAKCRTSSHSVKHENTYRNKGKKFCYGKHVSPTVSSDED